MTSSACSILESEPERFLDYLLDNNKIRSRIFDEKSFGEALRKVLTDDPSLKNIADSISSAGESFEICGKQIFDSPLVQNLIERNKKEKEQEIKKRVQKQKPSLTGKALEKEVQRRLKISLANSTTAISKGKQISLQDSLNPIFVSGYLRKGKSVKRHYRKTVRKLTMDERNLITNNIKRGKSISETYNAYLKSGLEFRSKISIKKHYYRIKRSMSP